MEPQRPRRVEAGAATRAARGRAGSIQALFGDYDVVYLELVLRVVVVTRSSPVSFRSPMASTSLPV